MDTFEENLGIFSREIVFGKILYGNIWIFLRKLRDIFLVKFQRRLRDIFVGNISGKLREIFAGRLRDIFEGNF